MDLFGSDSFDIFQNIQSSKDIYKQNSPKLPIKESLIDQALFYKNICNCSDCKKDYKEYYFLKQKGYCIDSLKKKYSSEEINKYFKKIEIDREEIFKLMSCFKRLTDYYSMRYITRNIINLFYYLKNNEIDIDIFIKDILEESAIYYSKNKKWKVINVLETSLPFNYSEKNFFINLCLIPEKYNIYYGVNNFGNLGFVNCYKHMLIKEIKIGDVLLFRGKTKVLDLHVNGSISTDLSNPFNPNSNSYPIYITDMNFEEFTDAVLITERDLEKMENKLVTLKSSFKKENKEIVLNNTNPLNKFRRSLNE